LKQVYLTPLELAEFHFERCNLPTLTKFCNCITRQ